MGEAKRRKEKDPFYGRQPKAGKGIVVSPRITIDQKGGISGSSFVDPVELRRAVLFWDRINKPSNNVIHFGLSPDEQFLNQCGILEEKMIRGHNVSGSGGLIYARLHLEAFAQLEADEPGLWCMSEGENSFNLQSQGIYKKERGALVELHRAVPLPKDDVPLSDLLEFKERRRDEVKSLSLELDSLFSRISNGEDFDFELKRSISEIDQKCSDIIAVGRESNISFSLSDFSFGVSLDFNSSNLLRDTVIGGLIGNTFGLPIVGGAIGAAASTISFNLGIGGKLERSNRNKKLALSPYRVVSRLINEPL